jgi:oligopeptide/dipeptide ABC transporter ATP-binding protein
VPRGYQDRRSTRERIVLTGDVPSPVDPPSGCVFHTRCPQARLVSGNPDEVPENCRTVMPPLGELDREHHAACWYPLTAGDALQQAARV